jgi:hypothetical protein
MLKAINTFTSLATLTLLFAVLQALDPIISRAVIDGKLSNEEKWAIGRTVVITMLAIAIKHKENPLEYTPGILPGDSLTDVAKVLDKLKNFNATDDN